MGNIFDPKRFMHTVILILIALVVIVGFFLVRGAYEFVYLNTTGEPFTDIMRRTPVYYVAGVAILCGVLARLDFHANIRLVIMVSMLGAGFVGGHAYWP